MRNSVKFSILVALLSSGCQFSLPPLVADLSLKGDSAARDQQAAQKAQADAKKLRLIRAAREIEAMEKTIIRAEKRMANDELGAEERAQINEKIEALRTKRNLIRARWNAIESLPDSSKMKEGMAKFLESELAEAQQLVTELSAGNEAYFTRKEEELDSVRQQRARILEGQLQFDPYLAGANRNVSGEEQRLENFANSTHRRVRATTADFAYHINQKLQAAERLEGQIRSQGVTLKDAVDRVNMARRRSVHMSQLTGDEAAKVRREEIQMYRAEGPTNGLEIVSVDFVSDRLPPSTRDGGLDEEGLLNPVVVTLSNGETRRMDSREFERAHWAYSEGVKTQIAERKAELENLLDDRNALYAKMSTFPRTSPYGVAGRSGDFFKANAELISEARVSWPVSLNDLKNVGWVYTSEGANQNNPDEYWSIVNAVTDIRRKRAYENNRRAVLQKRQEARALDQQISALQSILNDDVATTEESNAYVVRRTMSLEAASEGLLAGSSLDYLSILDSVALPTDYDYTYDHMDISFWDVPSEREAVTGTPLAADTASAPDRLTNYLPDDASKFVFLNGVPSDIVPVQASPSITNASYTGSIKHVYQFDGGAISRGVGTIDLEYRTGGVELQAAFTLADQNGVNLLSGDMNEFQFVTRALSPAGIEANISYDYYDDVGTASDIGFYGDDASNIGGKISVDIDLLQMAIPVTGDANQSFKSRGVFGAQQDP